VWVCCGQRARCIATVTRPAAEYYTTSSGLLVLMSASLFLFAPVLAAPVGCCVQKEANFRFGLVRVREHAEEIAFYNVSSESIYACPQFQAEMFTS
jgi:ABC-type uncharacterized transport system fused permease/ATPase subunit